ncbi:MAG: ABC transporter permease [Candidatus Marinimicrobia bacterium]|jgi:lipopolysaccharide transport system permease protein|nr:ABC transporter permease [Candidatus Neomarinimicrobiota bacterium]MCK9484872.1 ABC transporter permease [Candidatus Neomarinimicrobiota bacterium]
MKKNLKDDIIVIQPVRIPSWQDIREIFHYRELGFFLVWRDLKLRYRQTVLGVSWAILQPFLQMVVLAIFFGRLIKVPSDGVPYPVFVYAGLLPWTFFANAVNACNYAVINNAGLIRKIYFPRLLIPLSAVGTGLVDFLLAFLMLIVIMLFYHMPVTLGMLWLIPLTILLSLTGLGIGALLSALAVAYRDVRHIVPFLVQLWFFVTPVIYPATIISDRFKPLLNLNPMAGIVSGFRAVVLNQTIDFAGLYQAGAMGLLFCLAGVLYFSRKARDFADVV